MAAPPEPEQRAQENAEKNTPGFAQTAQSAQETPEMTAVDWEKIAKKAKAVSEQWRSMHSAEEARASEARALAAQAVKAVRRAEEDRDAAIKRAEQAEKVASAARQERARWKARSDAQTASKTFLNLEDAREALNQRDTELSRLDRTIFALQQEHDAYKAARKKEDAEREAAARERLEESTREREEAVAEAKHLEQSLERTRAQLSTLMAECPPGALEAARAQCARHETTIATLEKKCETLRKSGQSWRDRAKGAIASERLTQLQSGPMSMPMVGGGGFGGAGGGTHATGMYGGLPLPASGAAVSSEDLSRLRAELEYWRGEAEHEVSRQKGFQAALWASDAFSQTQKQRAMAWLRDPPPLSQHVAGAGAEAVRGARPMA